MKTRKPAPEKVEVRMSSELREKLVADAEAQDRSVNQQAVHYIRVGMRIDQERDEALRRIEEKLDRLLALSEKQ